MPTSFSCQRSSSRSTLLIGTSPLPAERSAGLESALRKKIENKIKNPATSAGRIRPSLWRLFRAPSDGCARSSFLFLSGVRNQPHLWMSRQARSVSRLPLESRLHRLQYSIGSIQIPVKGHSRFLHLAVVFPCEFHRQVVEIDVILRDAPQLFSGASPAILRE